MKNIAKVGIALLILFSVSTIFFYQSCKTDPCKNKVCNHDGTCSGDTCKCATGYEGSDCSTISRDKFIKAWTVMSSSCLTTTPFPSWTVTASTDTSSDRQLKFSNFSNFPCGAGAIVVSCTITSVNTFIIDNQTACGITFSGSGVLSGTQLVVSYTYNSTTFGSGTCTETWN